MAEALGDATPANLAGEPADAPLPDMNDRAGGRGPIERWRGGHRVRR
jgi:hypothetical protein